MGIIKQFFSILSELIKTVSSILISMNSIFQDTEINFYFSTSFCTRFDKCKFK